jgi:hypothetical protein
MKPKKVKKERDKVYPRFTKEQLKIIKSLVGQYGNTPSEVVSRIVMMWLDSKSFLTDIVKKKLNEER